MLVAAVALPSELSKAQVKQIQEFTFAPALNLPFHEKYELHKEAFITLQVLDIYSTYRALKYNCVMEMNPILGDVPTIPQMVLLKSIAQGYVISNDTVSDRAYAFMNVGSTLVVVNNYQVWNKARKKCTRR